MSFDITSLLQKFTKSIGEVLENSTSLEDLLPEIRENTDLLGLHILEEHLELLDEEIKKSPQRKEDWYVERSNDKKTILTEMGSLSYARTYYSHKREKEYCYLIDELLQIEPHQRLDNGYQNHLLQEATEKSYEKTTQTVGKDKVSRQTVKNLLHKYQPEDIKKVVIPKEKKKVPYLYIDADEDHVSVLDNKTQNQNLVYVYEGKSTKGTRKELINPYYITGRVGKELFEEAFAYIKANYDLTSVKRIYIQGDGAGWIKGGTNIIPNSRSVLDRYHISKYVNDCTANNGVLKARLYKALYEQQEELDVVMNDILDEGVVTEERVFACFKYFYQNASSIAIWNTAGEYPVGCSAESHVSHMLSHRLSSRPLTWSRKGANNMAKLRVYLKNGGTMKELREDSNYMADIEKKHAIYINPVVNRGKIMYDEYNNMAVLTIGRRNGIYKALKQIRGIS